MELKIDTTAFTGTTAKLTTVQRKSLLNSNTYDQNPIVATITTTRRRFQELYDDDDDDVDNNSNNSQQQYDKEEESYDDVI